MKSGDLVKKELFTNYFDINIFTNHKKLFCFYNNYNDDIEEMIVLLKSNQVLLDNLKIKVFFINFDSLIFNDSLKKDFKSNFYFLSDDKVEIAKEFNLITYRDVYLKRKIAYLKTAIYLVDENDIVTNFWLDDNDSYHLEEIIIYLKKCLMKG